MNRARLEALEARINPTPRVVVVIYRGAEQEDQPMTPEERALYHQLLREALENAPDARGYSLFLDPSNPRWVVWEQPEGL